MTEKMDTQSPTTFIMAAKSFVGMVRDNNEDNFQAAADLDTTPMLWPKNNQPYELGGKGALIVVADGMGGMNAGEVASKIAIDTVNDCFAREKITDEVVMSQSSAERFMKSVITEADSRIKQHAKDNPETKGMGTTMVMGWVLGQSLYVSWAGDSRAYVFNPSYGLKRLSKDHSLVQQLVDSGKISKEDAFDYPDSNVITNCLSAIDQKAVPDVLDEPHRLQKGDIILLCSDGLCGLIRDTEIQSVINAHQDDMEACCSALIKAACDAGGHDNVTVALCKIVSLKESDEEPTAEENHRGRLLIKLSVIIALVVLAAALAWHFASSSIVVDGAKITQNPIPPVPPENAHTPTFKSSTGEERNDVIAELETSSNNEQILTIKDKAQTVFFVFKNFQNRRGNDILTCGFENKHIRFKAKDFESNKITGTIYIKDKDNKDPIATIELKNIPLTKKTKSPSNEGNQTNDQNNKSDGSGDKFNPSTPSQSNQEASTQPNSEAESTVSTDTEVTPL